MPRLAGNNSQPTGSAIGFEATLWSAVEKLKGNMDAEQLEAGLVREAVGLALVHVLR